MAEVTQTSTGILRDVELMLLHKLLCTSVQAQQQYRLALKTCWLRKPCLALPAVYPKESNIPAAVATEVSPKPHPPSVFLLLANPAMAVRQVIFKFGVFLLCSAAETSLLQRAAS